MGSSNINIELIPKNKSVLVLTFFIIIIELFFIIYTNLN